MINRTERDSLGTLQVPAGAYYGINTTRALTNFPITGYKISDVADKLVVSLVMVKKAAAMANRETGKLKDSPVPVWESIIAACDELISGAYHEQFCTDPIQGGAGTSLNMNANEVIANIALEHINGCKKGDYHVIDPNNHVNMSQSTNDVLPTASHIAIRLMLDDLLETMKELYTSFDNKAKEFDKYVKIGRTHLQDAVPIRLGQEFDAYARVLKRDIDRIEKTGHYLYEVNMGATAVGTALNTNPEYVESVMKHLKAVTSEYAGRDFPLRRCESLVDGTQNTDCYTEVSATLKICMMNMSKIASDLRLMVSGPGCGLGEITLEERQAGSSIMPDKVNPVIPEVVNQVAFQVIGNDHTICLASEAGQFELNVMQPVLVFNLIESINMMDNVFKVFGKLCVDKIRITSANEERMSNNLNRSASLAAALIPAIGYAASGEIAKKARTERKSILEVCLEDTDLVAKLGEEKIKDLLDPDQMTRWGEKLKH
ncbi:MAG: aspartate ammonia-lyase [Turicibacter sp.]|nr:aspartate ammonia-lyase [Turicibacter sp.]